MAIPGVGTGFGDLYISSNTIHGYVNEISGATSYKVWYRPSTTTTAQSTTADADGYFFITGLTPNVDYHLNYQGINSSGTGKNMADAEVHKTENSRSSWTLFSSTASWGNFASGGTKPVSYLTDDSYLYRYSMSFEVSGTVSIEVDANFSVASYISTTTSYNISNGKPTSDIAHKENSGSSYTLTASVTAGTTYYLYFRGNSGRPYIGKISLNLTAPTKVVQKPVAGKILSTSVTQNSITLVGSEIAYATYYQFAIRKGAGTTYYHKSTSPTYTFTSLDQDGTISILPATSYTVNYRGMNDDADGSYTTQKTVTTSEAPQGGYVHIYNGLGWKKAIPYIYNGSAWKQAIPYVHNGSTWKNTTG